MVNILIVDDHPMVEIALKVSIKGLFNDFNLFFCQTFQEAIEEQNKNEFSLIILDLGIPGGKGVEMIGELRGQNPLVKILIFSGRDEVLNAHYYVKNGADGYLHKNAQQKQLETAINTVLSGKKYLSPQVQREILNNILNNDLDSADPIATLSNREREVLNLLMMGKTTKQIGGDMNIKFSTVSTLKARIFSKLQVVNSLELYKKMEAYS